jgi:membrane protease subunit (stomatin/prohibitin family)
MCWRFERHGNEIKFGAQLTVREGQVAVFVHEGRIADVFPPGLYTLETRNLPVLSTLQAWPHGFESPFKAEVYFVATRRFPNLKWGTRNPIMLRDREFGPVRLRAFGTYEVRVTDPPTFLREIVGTDGRFTTDEIAEALRNMILTRIATALGAGAIPVLDLAANQQALSEYLTNALKPDFAQYGLELTRLLVENISLPPEVEQALDSRTKMGVIGDLRAYAQFQAAEAMAKAAANPSGGSGAAVGAGVGLGLGQQIAAALAPNPWGTAPAPPPPPAAAPPPVPERQWFIALGGTAHGPLAESALLDQARAGHLKRDTLVWREGMSDWKPASEVPELAFALVPVPPPLPGA